MRVNYLDWLYTTSNDIGYWPHLKNNIFYKNNNYKSWLFKDPQTQIAESNFGLISD